LKLVAQPNNSFLCGHACLAMILNLTLDEAIILIGHEKKTCRDELRKILWIKGIALGPKHDVPSSKGLWLGKVPKPSHYVIIYNGKIYDPHELRKIYDWAWACPIKKLAIEWQDR